MQPLTLKKAAILLGSLIVIAAAAVYYLGYVKNAQPVGKFESTEVTGTASFIRKSYYLDVGDSFAKQSTCVPSLPLWPTGPNSTLGTNRYIVCANGSKVVAKDKTLTYYGFGWDMAAGSLIDLEQSLANTHMTALSLPGKALHGTWKCAEDTSWQGANPGSAPSRIFDCKITDLTYDIGTKQINFSIAVFTPARDLTVRNFMMVSDFGHTLELSATSTLRTHAKEVTRSKNDQALNMTIIDRAYASGAGGAAGPGDGGPGDCGPGPGDCGDPGDPAGPGPAGDGPNDCPGDTMLCADGSSVSREFPGCGFAACANDTPIVNPAQPSDPTNPAGPTAPQAGAPSITSFTVNGATSITVQFGSPLTVLLTTNEEVTDCEITNSWDGSNLLERTDYHFPNRTLITSAYGSGVYTLTATCYNSAGNSVARAVTINVLPVQTTCPNGALDYPICTPPADPSNPPFVGPPAPPAPPAPSIDQFTVNGVANLTVNINTPYTYRLYTNSSVVNCSVVSARNGAQLVQTSTPHDQYRDIPETSTTAYTNNTVTATCYAANGTSDTKTVTISAVDPTAINPSDPPNVCPNSLHQWPACNSCKNPLMQFPACQTPIAPDITEFTADGTTNLTVNIATPYTVRLYTNNTVVNCKIVRTRDGSYALQTTDPHVQYRDIQETARTAITNTLTATCYGADGSSVTKSLTVTSVDPDAVPTNDPSNVCPNSLHKWPACNACKNSLLEYPLCQQPQTVCEDNSRSILAQVFNNNSILSSAGILYRVYEYIAGPQSKCDDTLQPVEVKLQ